MKTPFEVNESLVRKLLSKDEWASIVTNAQAMHGKILVDMPRGCVPADFVSYIYFVAKKWRNGKEAAEMLRIVANMFEPSATDPTGQTEEAETMSNPTQAIDPQPVPPNGYIDNKSEWHADAQWALKQWQDGAFDNHSEDYAAIFRKEVKGYGDDPNELRKIWSENCGVPFQRIIVHYIGTEE